jgi:acetyltransferase-like isoleucine patch superfamily enzyme
MKYRFYCVPGFVLSVLLSCIPSFRLCNVILRLFGNKIGDGTTFHNDVRFVLPIRLEVGRNSTINNKVFLDTRKGIQIGSNTMIGRESQIFTLTHDVHDEQFKAVGDKVVIGDNVVIFPSVKIMPGVTIEDNAVVYPGSIVTKDVKERTIVAGVPAKEVGRREVSVKYTLNYKMFLGT